MTNLPNDFALNKRPRQMARKPRKQLGRIPLIMLGFLGALCGVLLLSALLGVMLRYTAVDTADNQPMNSAYYQNTAQVSEQHTAIDTLTPTPTPTPTPMVTATFSPPPQLSPTVENVQKGHTTVSPAPQIEVTRLVSTTPQPTATRYPTYTHVPSSTPTVSILAIKARHDYEMTMRREAALMSVFEFVTSEFFLGLITVGVLLLVGRVVWGTLTKRVDTAIDEASSATTREEMELQPYRDEIDALLNRSLKLYGETQPTRLAGWREMEWHPEDWTAVVKYMRSIGFRIVTHNVGSSESPGTYLLAGNLHHWRNRWFMGLLR